MLLGCVELELCLVGELVEVGEMRVPQPVGAWGANQAGCRRLLATRARPGHAGDAVCLASLGVGLLGSSEVLRLDG